MTWHEATIIIINCNGDDGDGSDNRTRCKTQIRHANDDIADAVCRAVALGWVFEPGRRSFCPGHALTRNTPLPASR